MTFPLRRKKKTPAKRLPAASGGPRLERAAFVVYLVVLIWSPVMFGAVVPFAYTVTFLGVLAGSGLLLVHNIRRDPETGARVLRIPRTALNPLFLLILLFLGFQLLPLPDPLLQWLSPESRVVGHMSVPASQFAGPADLAETWFSLAPHSHSVRMSLARWTVYGLYALGLIQVLNSRKRIELTLSLILGLAVFEVLYGLQAYAGVHYVLWYRIGGATTTASGTYMNYNHFAGLLEMCLLPALGYFGALMRIRSTGKGPPLGTTRLRARISVLFSGERHLNKRFLVLLSVVVIGIGLLFSASRGGVLSAAGGLMALGLLFLLKKGYRGQGFLVLAVFAVTGLYALHLGVERPLERFTSLDRDLGVRTRYAGRTLELFNDYRLSGVGVGNFAQAYRKYQDPEDKQWTVLHAHNDWAQFLAEAGLLGFSLMGAGTAYFLYRTLRAWKGRADPFAVCLGAASLGAMAAIGIHSWVDFNLHVPANFLMLAAVAAIGTAALNLQKRHGRVRSLLAFFRLPLRGAGAPLLALVSLLILVTGSWTVRHFVAEAYCATFHHAALNRDPNPPEAEILKAVAWDGGNAGYWWKLAWERIRQRDALQHARDRAFSPTADERHSEPGMPPSLPGPGRKNPGARETKDPLSGMQMRIVRAIEEAVKRNPLVPEFHIQAGWEYARLGKAAGDPQTWLSAADRSMERAAYYAGHFPSIHETLGNYWVIRSKGLPPVGPQWEAAMNRARWHYQKAVSLTGGYKPQVERIRKEILTYYPDEAFVERLL